MKFRCHLYSCEVLGDLFSLVESQLLYPYIGNKSLHR